MSTATIAEILASFASPLRLEDVPPAIQNYAKHLILDGVGTGLAAINTNFAGITLRAAQALGTGTSIAMGLARNLSLRDAAMVNGVLIHGLDFDDTHLEGVVHGTASCFPTALALGAELQLSGKDVLLAYVLGFEVAARVGAVAKGELNQLGYHPTGIAGAFGCAVAAGRLLELDREQMTMAQGIVLSMASGTREYSSDGSSSKRLHPGWAAASGITAAYLAKEGFTGPRTAYEGRFGLFPTHLGASTKPYDLPAMTRGFHEVWETRFVAVKPFPSCQLNIACIDAAIALGRQNKLTFDNIVEIEAIIPPHAVAIVCEPAARKVRPASPYAAQFSLYFSVACGLLHGKLGLAELELHDDERIASLAGKVRYTVNPNTNYPHSFSGEVRIRLQDGSELSHLEEINRGAAARPISNDEIIEKYRANATLSVPQDRASRICATILNIENFSAREVADVLAP